MGADLFWRKVDKCDSGCWVWTGAKKPKGYGNLRINRRWMLAHRVSWEIANGPIPKGLLVCHHCDNPSCVRPSHLFLGTVKDNTADMLRKGRHGGKKISAANKGMKRANDHLRGARNHNAKLTDDKVAAIRELLRKGERQQVIADAYGVTDRLISQIKLGRIWKHVSVGQ